MESPIRLIMKTSYSFAREVAMEFPELPRRRGDQHLRAVLGLYGDLPSRWCGGRNLKIFNIRLWLSRQWIFELSVINDSIRWNTIPRRYLPYRFRTKDTSPSERATRKTSGFPRPRSRSNKSRSAPFSWKGVKRPVKGTKHKFLVGYLVETVRPPIFRVGRFLLFESAAMHFLPDGP